MRRLAPRPPASPKEPDAMVKIRMTRGGATKRPFYRVVAIDERDKRDGRCLEFLGTYEPKTNPPTVKLDVAKVDAWVAKGAQLSETVRSLLAQARRAAGSAAS
jgi:small subunit ribosomal protein S16